MPMFPSHIHFWTFSDSIIFFFSLQDYKVWETEQLLRNHKNRREKFVDPVLIRVDGDSGRIIDLVCCAFKKNMEAFTFGN